MIELDSAKAFIKLFVEEYTPRHGIHLPLLPAVLVKVLFANSDNALSLKPLSISTVDTKYQSMSSSGFQYLFQ
jgi:hypothetical protein